MAPECLWPYPYRQGETYPILDEERIARRVIELLKEECPELFKKTEPT